MISTYDENSIQEMDPLTFCRHRPDTYLGSNENSTQLVREIVSNCSDEFLIGNCTEVHITYDEKNNVIDVEDNGQGIIPNVWKDDGSTVLEQVYGRINTSGKYDKSDTAVYKISTGAFGIGASLTNFLSHWLEATTYRDGKYEQVRFVEGKFNNRISGKAPTNKHGVKVKFKPSEEFFRDARPNVAQLKKELFELSCVCSGLKFFFNEEEIYHPNGLEDIVTDAIGKNKEVISKRCTFQEKVSDSQLFDFCMSFTDSSNVTIIPFCNYGLIESGTPVTALKTALTRTFNDWAQEQEILKKNQRLNGSDIQEGIVVAFNLVSQNVRYDSQTKVRATHTEDNKFISDTLSKQLEVWLDNNPDDGRKIIEKAALARRAAEAAKKAREAVKQQRQKKKKNKILHPDKLKDAEYLGQDSTLLVVEGLSAGASVAVARDVSKYGILMLRGKLINAFTNSETKLLKNEEIQLLLQALNIEPGNYDSSQLRYGRVAICTDSDSDGYNIGLLIAAALQHFCPEFIKEGRLCWLRSPLYILKGKKKDTYFFTDAELNAARAKAKLQGDLQRNKGLGSLSAEQARASMFGDNQHIDVIKSDDSSILLLEKLMGTNVAGRKNYIFENIDFAEVRE